MENYVALICARGGSKGVPGKNIRPLDGVPLIGYAIQAALQVTRINRVVVSTDSEEIAAVSLEYGAEVPFMRPAELAGDTSPEWLAWQHAVHSLRSEMGGDFGLVVVPATAPLRSSEDLDRCLDAYEEGDVDTVITVTEAHRSPYFNMVKHDPRGYARLVIESENRFCRRQDVPEVYDMTTVAYVAGADFVMSHNGIFDGRVKSVFVPPERAIDIDTELDFMIAECLLARGKEMGK